jgi:hypothetical protein
LTNAHANLEGMSNCTKCHELGDKVHNSRCLDCHTVIKSLINSGSGYHAGSEVKGKNCWSCHSEHHGRNFRIVNFNADNFNHDKSGFSLTGKHKTTDCDKCHKAEFILDKEIKKRKGTYLGLNTDCFSCHEDIHQKTLGDRCDDCHNTEAFKPAPKFDHNYAEFKLTGKHVQVECISCHKIENKNGKKYQAFKNIPFGNCNACHKDVHNGSFGPNCSKCHQTSSFKNIIAAAFDHNKTRFPLIGKHNAVACNKCHKDPANYKMKFDLCTDCHTDFHKAQFVVNGMTQNCKACHNENGFHPSLFTLEMHNKGKFRLMGGHLATPCESCHYKQRDWIFIGTSVACIECHKNIHENELKPEFLTDNNCEICHQTENWHTITFDHNKTDFPLLGKHSSVSCGSCHTKEENGAKSIIFTSQKKDCESCHKDAHFGQFRVDGISDCGRCHAYENWKPERFDHNKTEFSLEGAHEKVECAKCHPRITQNGNTFVKFKLEEFKCATCHKK